MLKKGLPPSETSIPEEEKNRRDSQVENSSTDALDSDSDAALEKRVWRKLDVWILPVVTIFYLLSFLVSPSSNQQIKARCTLSDSPIEDVVRSFTELFRRAK